MESFGFSLCLVYLMDFGFLEGIKWGFSVESGVSSYDKEWENGEK
jgi:hypothetical protein